MVAVPTRTEAPSTLQQPVVHPARRRGRVLALAVAGVGLELVLVAGFLIPFNLWQHPAVIEGSHPVVTVLGGDSTGAAELLATIVSAFGAFGLGIWTARRAAGRAAAFVVLAGVMVFAGTLAAINPVGAQDVYHNVADARTFWVYGQDPAVTPPNAHPDDPFFQHVTAWEDHASSYGPLWYMLSGAALPMTGAELWPNVFGQRLITTTALLCTTALVMAVASRIGPGRGVLAGVLVGWNPLVLFDAVGNAHNDIVMVGFVAAAVYVAARRWWLAVFALLACAVAVKPVAALLGPVFLLWMLRQSAVSLPKLSLALLAGLVVTGLLYLPFTNIRDVLDALSRHSDPVLGSTGAVVASLLISETYMDPEVADDAMKRIVVVAFFLCYLPLLLPLRRRDASIGVLTAVSAWAMFAFLVTAKWWFWPWYVMWMLPLAAMTPSRRVAFVAVVFSFTAMLFYVAYMWQVFGPDWHEIHRETAATVFGIPLALVLVLLLSDLALSLIRRVVAATRRPRQPEMARSSARSR